jgi:hypothetical protein
MDHVKGSSYRLIFNFGSSNVAKLIKETYIWPSVLQQNKLHCRLQACSLLISSLLPLQLFHHADKIGN